jgi:protein O-GlcNAc transferase
MEKVKIHLVIENLRAGKLEKAEDICREIIRDQPENAEALHFLGLIYFQRSDYNTATDYIKKALQLNPHFADAYNNLGIIYQNKGQLHEAVVHYQRALQLKPNFVHANYNLAIVLQAAGQIEEALSYYQKTIALNPNIAGAYYYSGVILQMKGQHEEAIAYYLKTIELDPGHLDAYNNLGVELQNQEQFEKAIQCYQRAIELDPNYAQAYNNLGNALNEVGQWEKAIESYVKAVTIKPDYTLAHYNMGNILGYQGRLDEATSAYNKALASNPDFVTARWARCISQLPIIYPDKASIRIVRERYYKDLIQLQDSISLDTPQNIEEAAKAVGSHQPFLLACQGLNDRDLQKRYGELVCKIMSYRYPQFTERRDVPPGEPLRIGIVSAYFHYHSIWKIPLRGFVENIDKDRFHLYGYHTGRIKDHATESAKTHCKKFLEDIASFEELCHIIHNDNLHVLLYPEIGMDQMTLRLASLRFASVQCTTLGHPDTSGLPTIDYYLSSDLMEPTNADEHYTEKLIRLPNLGFYYTPFDVPSVNVNRETFRLRPKSVLYLCSHALFTYLPQYDEVFPLIAQQIDDCQFLFISHQEKRSIVTDQFRIRIKQAFKKFNMDDENYITFLPQLDPGYYHAINCLSDVFLDSIGWSANNSTFEAIACNLPVVTFPGTLMRQNHCKGILTMMGLTETIASSIDDYVAIAVRLGKDPEWRGKISSKIASNKHLLYHDKTCINALEDFLEKTASEKGQTPC